MVVRKGWDGGEQSSLFRDEAMRNHVGWMQDNGYTSYQMVFTLTNCTLTCTPAPQLLAHTSLVVQENKTLLVFPMNETPCKFSDRPTEECERNSNNMLYS